MLDPNFAGPKSSMTWQIEAELLNGPWLLLGQALPLNIKIKKLHAGDCQIYLHDFQTQLVETTQLHACGFGEISKHSWIIQTMANMEQKICTDNNPFGTEIILPSVIWSSHTLPSALTPSFEICNIKRDYQLEVRLGFRMGLSKVHYKDPNRRNTTPTSKYANISRNC